MVNVHGSRLKAHGSCLRARDSRPLKMWQPAEEGLGPKAFGAHDGFKIHNNAYTAIRSYKNT